MPKVMHNEVKDDDDDDDDDVTLRQARRHSDLVRVDDIICNTSH